jgi:endonuclease/exonuclease/phosphatase (EEP) superfamily protein YafD
MADKDQTLQEEKPRRSKGAITLSALLMLAGGGVGAASMLGFLGAQWWALDLLAHFRVQYFILLTVVAVALLALQRWRSAIVFTVLALVNLAVIAPLYFGRTDAGPGSAKPIRVMLLNVNTRSGDIQRVVKLIPEVDADIMVLEEVDERWLAGLRSVTNAYPHSTLQPRPDNFGIAVFSKFPFRRARVESIGDADVPSIVARIQAPRGEFEIIATHPVPPMGDHLSRARNGQLDALAERARAAEPPVLLLGDLNITPWSPHFGRLLERSGLRDSERGHGVQPTWPAFNPLLRIPIDHCLHSPGIEILSRRIGPAVGSDHYPLIVEFVIRDDTQPTD